MKRRVSVPADYHGLATAVSDLPLPGPVSDLLRGRQAKEDPEAYCHCKGRFETDGGVPNTPVEHDIRVQIVDRADG